MRQTLHLGDQGVAAETGSRDGCEGIELPFLQNSWYVAGWSSEFDTTGPFGRIIIDQRIVLYRKRDGRLVALQDRCAHRWAPLSFGRVEGDSLRCMYHGVKFDADGRSIEVPGQARVARALCVRSYPVIEKHRFVWVWMGDPVMADPSVIPDLGMLDQRWRRLYYGTLDFEAHYALLNDNLSELSQEVKPLDTGVRVESWIYGPRPPSVLVTKKAPDGDLWTRTDVLAPGILVSDDRMYPPGTAQECAGLPPRTEQTPLSDVMRIQAVTPVTARKTRFFYSIGPRAVDVDLEEADTLWEIVRNSYLEDLRVIEAQQRIIDAHPGHRMGVIAADRGLVLFRGVMKRLIANETLPAPRIHRPVR